MHKRRIYDEESHAHFVTFSCYRRRRLLDHDLAKQIVLSVLSGQLHKQNSKCVGFVVMPNHVHAILWFPKPNQLSKFMKLWKQQSSLCIKNFLRERLVKYAETIDLTEPIWQGGYYDFNLFSEKKILEKLQYMHQNPVIRNLVSKDVDWHWSSARYYESRENVGVPVEWIE
ncbi:MAG: REP-associated tyrosine transposase [Planctomycetaceae bacterium]